MNLQAVSQRLRDVLPLPAARRGVGIECIGLSYDAQRTLVATLDHLSSLLAVKLELRPHSGDIVFVDSVMASGVAPHQLAQAYGHRPLVAVANRDLPEAEALTPYHLGSDLRQSELLQLLRTIPVVRQHNAVQRKQDRRQAWLAELADWPDDEASFVRQLLTGMLLPETPPLQASYPSGDSIGVDFLRGEVRMDACAWERLCVAQELPTLPGAPPRHNALRLDLDKVVWAVGLASARRALLGAAPQWRHASVKAAGRPSLRRYSLRPSHLALAEHLLEGSTTPARLQAQARVSEADLRAFLQAGLFVGFVYWG